MQGQGKDLENHMVINVDLEDDPASEKVVSPHYEHILGEEPDIPDEKAYSYAKENLDSLSQEDKDEFVEWFFSGNWVKVE